MKKILILILILISVAVHAADYYVATAANGGSNAKTGLSGQPVLTVYKASTIAIAVGDIIHIGTGSFTETQRCSIALGVSVEGNGVNNTTIISTYAAGSAEYGVLDLFSVNEATNGNQHISGISFNGSSLTGRVAISIYKRSNVIIHHCNFDNFNDMAIFIRGNTTWNVEPTAYSTGNQIYNCVINNCAIFSDGWARGAIYFGGQDGLLIHDNYINQTQRVSTSNGICIKSASLSWSKRLKIYNNTLVKLPHDGATWSFCLELWYCTGELEIYNNTVTGRMDLVDIKKGSLSYGAKVYNNTFGWDELQTTTNGGIQFETVAEFTTVYDNTFKNLTYGIYFTFGDGGVNSYSDNVVIRNNTMTIGKAGQAYSGFGIYFEGAAASPPVSNVYIYNNVMKGTLTNKGDIGIEFGLSANLTMTNIHIQNNIIQNFENSVIRVYPNTKIITIDSLYITNNNMLGNGNSNLPRFTNFTPSNYTISNNISANPLFVSSSDFHLQSGSTSINAGVDVGLPYSGSAPDIGRYEYVVETPVVIAVVTMEVITVLSQSAIAYGDIVLDGGGTISAKGVCWDTSVNPTIANSKTVDGSGTAEFISTITGLMPNTTYHVRAYATNEAGTSYSSDKIFMTAAASGSVGLTNGKVGLTNGKVTIY